MFSLDSRDRAITCKEDIRMIVTGEPSSTSPDFRWTFALPSHCIVSLLHRELAKFGSYDRKLSHAIGYLGNPRARCNSEGAVALDRTEFGKEM